MSSISRRFPGVPRLSRAVFAALLAFPLALLALAPLSSRAAAHPAYPTAPRVGKSGSPAVDLTLHFRSTVTTGADPTLLATDAAGNLYVSDITTEQVKMYDTNDIFVRAFGTGTMGSGNGDFNTPVGVVVTGGTVYVVDFNNNRIETFNQSTDAYISQFGSAQLNQPNGLALGSNGTLYVADSGNNRIAEFDTSGNFLGSFGSAGTGTGQFNFPLALAFNPTNSELYVTDTANTRVEAFTLGGSYVTQWGHASFLLPAGIAVDRAGMVYVIDRNAQTVYKFDPGGSLVGFYAAPPPPVGVRGTFITPTGVAVRSIANAPIAVYIGDEATGAGDGFVQRFDQVLNPQLHTY